MADSKRKNSSPTFLPFPLSSGWRKLPQDLKGADFEKKLVWKTNEGFKVKPFYRMEDLEGLKTTDALPGEFPISEVPRKTTMNGLFVRKSKWNAPKRPMPRRWIS